MSVELGPADAPADAHSRALVRPSDEIPRRHKIGYGLGSAVDVWGHGNFFTFAFLIFGQFLGVRLALVGVAVVVARLLEALFDAIFGWISDHTRSRFGRRRPYMLLGAVAAGLGLPIIVAVGPGWGATHLWGRTIPNYFWFMLGSSALYLPLVSCFNMPYSSLGYELTPDSRERTRLFAWKYFMQKLPEVGLFYAGQFVSMAVWVGATRGNLGERLRMLFTHASAWGKAPAGTAPNLLLGAQVFCAVCGLMLLVAGISAFAMVSEPYYGQVLARAPDRASLREAIWETLQCRPFRLQVIMCVAFGLGLSVISSLGYADTIYYVCRGDVSLGNWWNFRMGLAGMGAGALGVPVFAALARRWGKRPAMIAVFASGALIAAATWWLYTPAFPGLQMIATALIAFMGSGFWTIHESIGADIVDCDELQTGKRREGAFAASLNGIMKFSMAIGAGLSFAILDGLGLKCQNAGAQSEHTLWGIRLILAGVPLVGLTVALFAAWRLDISYERMGEIRRALEARRGGVVADNR